MNLRFEALAAVSRNPGAPLDELVGMLSVSGKPARQAVLDAKKGGLLSLMRDDVTGQPGYVLTEAGKKRLNDGPDKLNGSNMVKGVQPERLKAAAKKCQPVHEPVHEPAPKEDAMPEPDPALLALANRMLTERLNGVAHALRGSCLAGLANVTGSEDLQPHVAALTGAYQMALAEPAMLRAELAKADAKLKAIHALLAQRVAGPLDPNDLSAEECAEKAAALIDETVEIISNATTREAQQSTMGEILGYEITNGPSPLARTVDEAIELAKSFCMQGRADAFEITEVRKIGEVVRSIEWRPA